MTPYFLLLSVPMLASMVVAIERRPRAVGWLWMLPVFALYLVFVGWRNWTGSDWYSYQAIHSRVLNQTFLETMSEAEPLSYGLFWLTRYFGYGFHLSNAIAAFIFLGGVFAFAMQTPNPFLAVVVASPFLVIVMGMSALRQSMAIGVLFLLFSIWRRTNLAVRLGLIGLAALFHLSAVVMAILAVPMSAGARLLNLFDSDRRFGGVAIDSDRRRTRRRQRHANDQHREFRSSRMAGRSKARNRQRPRRGGRRWVNFMNMPWASLVLVAALIFMGFFTEPGSHRINRATSPNLVVSHPRRLQVR